MARKSATKTTSSKTTKSKAAGIEKAVAEATAEAPKT